MTMLKPILSAAALAVAAAPAAAEVTSSSPHGFVSVNRAVVPVAPAAVYEALGRIGEWWDPAHSYSGRGDNLALELRAGGCFCETMDGGGTVEHLRVVHAAPGKMLRLQGGLGPLQAEAVAATLSWSLAPAEGGGTAIVQTYVVGGHIRAGAEAFAGPVNAVLAGQLERLRAWLSR